MLGWLFVTFGVALGSALLPVISVEVFVVGLATSAPSIHWAAIGAVVAAGQLLGKFPYYLAARGSIHLPKFLHDRLHRERAPTPRREKWRQRTKRVRGWAESLRERCHEHPHWMSGTYGVSSVIGIPPYMATAILAGYVHMKMSIFVGVGLTGRFIRFSALAAAPAVFSGWLHFD